MKKSYIIGGGITFILIALGVYFFLSGSNFSDLTAQKSKLENNLIEAESRLNKEKETLEDMKNGLQNSFPLGAGVQDQMARASALVNRTDFMFTDPDGANPELKFQDSLVSALINNQRQEINLLLSEWKKKTDILAIGEIDLNESQKIKEEAEAIQEFIENLYQLVENMTPENSELSQFEIDTYLSQLPTPEEINEVLASLETIIENSIIDAPQSPTADTETSIETSIETSTETNVGPSPGNNPETNPGTENSQNSPNSPTVTPDDIIAQEEVVAEAEEEVVILEEELAEVEEQIQQESPTTPPETDTVADENPEETVSEEDTDPNESDDEDNQDNPSQPFTPTQGIIIQPGPPRLIQGTDPY
jgi:hypothetical protein